MTAAGDADSGGAHSYRRPLYRLFKEAGIAVDFLGSQGGGPADYDSNHDAWGGAWIGPGGSDNNVYDRMPAVLPSSVDPDVVILALGWNSAVREPDLAADKYVALVDRVAALKPRAQLVLATLSPYRGNTDAETAGFWAGYRDLNQRARQLAAASNRDRRHLADLAAGGFGRSDFHDDIHWSQAGADRAARIIFEVIVKDVLPQLP